MIKVTRYWLVAILGCVSVSCSTSASKNLDGNEPADHFLEAGDGPFAPDAATDDSDSVTDSIGDILVGADGDEDNDGETYGVPSIGCFAGAVCMSAKVAPVCVNGNWTCPMGSIASESCPPDSGVVDASSDSG